MKKQYQYRKRLGNALASLGIKDITLMTEAKAPVTGILSNQLMNPQRRIVKAVLRLPKDRQLARLTELESQMAANAAAREADNALLENS